MSISIIPNPRGYTTHFVAMDKRSRLNNDGNLVSIEEKKKLLGE